MCAFISALIRLLEDSKEDTSNLYQFLSGCFRLLEDGKEDTHSDALLRAYTVAGNIYFCPEMSRGELENMSVLASNLVGKHSWSS